MSILNQDNSQYKPNMGALKYEMKNEMHVREYFAIHAGEFGYSIIASGSAYPDYALEDARGKKYLVEAEFESANFVMHGHDPRFCDFILCWIHTQAVPLPVLELSTGKMHEPNTEPAVKRERPLNPKPTTDERNHQIIKEMVGNYPKLYAAFQDAIAADLKAQSEYEHMLREPRLKLLTATQDLLRAIQEDSRLSDCNIHPYDLLRIVSTS